MGILRGLLGFVLLVALVDCGDGGTTARLKQRVAQQVAFFRASGNGVYDLGVSDDRGRRLEILTGESKPGTVWPQLFTTLSWSPDGKRIVFAGGEGPQTDEHDEPTNLYLVGLDGAKAQRITSFGDVLSPLWAPNGRTIAFSRARGGGGRPGPTELWSARYDGSDATRLLASRKGQMVAPGSFTPDGSRLAVTLISFDPKTRKSSSAVYVLRSNGTRKRRLIGKAGQPAFSPDGKRIAFTSDRDRNGRLCYGDQCSSGAELYVARADGSKPKRLTRTRAGNEASPAWSPDGSRIVYERGKVVDNAQGTGIFQMNRDGSCARRILLDPKLHTWYANPAVRPSGRGESVGPLSC